MSLFHLCDGIFADAEQESWYAAFEQQTNLPNVVNVNVADGQCIELFIGNK